MVILNFALGYEARSGESKSTVERHSLERAGPLWDGLCLGSCAWQQPCLQGASIALDNNSSWLMAHGESAVEATALPDPR